MSIADLSAGRAGLATRSSTAGLRSFALRLLRRLEAAEDRSRLHAMSDHMLRDIGLVRDQIDDALRQAGEAWR